MFNIILQAELRHTDIKFLYIFVFPIQGHLYFINCYKISMWHNTRQTNKCGFSPFLTSILTQWRIWHPYFIFCWHAQQRAHTDFSILWESKFMICCEEKMWFEGFRPHSSTPNKRSALHGAGILSAVYRWRRRLGFQVPLSPPEWKILAN